MLLNAGLIKKPTISLEAECAAKHENKCNDDHDDIKMDNNKSNESDDDLEIDDDELGELSLLLENISIDINEQENEITKLPKIKKKRNRKNSKKAMNRNG